MIDSYVELLTTRLRRCQFLAEVNRIETEQFMDPSLARGYATSVLAYYPDHSAIDEWLESARHIKAFQGFLDSIRSKKPGRVLERVGPWLAPVFRDPRIDNWSRSEKMIRAEAYAVSQASAVFELAQEEAPLFAEKAVFLMNLVLLLTESNPRVCLGCLASISHHGVLRLLQREVATPETMRAEIRAILTLAQKVGFVSFLSEPNNNSGRGYLFPWRGGALAAVGMRVRPSSVQRYDTQRVVAIRTWLAPEMLSDRQRERMFGFEQAFRPDKGLGEMGDLFDDRAKWLRGNLVPWSILTDPIDKSAGGPTQIEGTNHKEHTAL
ncbi:hypothetical protein IQ250_21640 [Pseudanabaenaceae cyanobacterium LEGE 13415]|nr:hypothetical protein [Pseudanabaenaceae cyanobacterium LEGE 13415]